MAAPMDNTRAVTKVLNFPEESRVYTSCYWYARLSENVLKPGMPYPKRRYFTGEENVWKLCEYVKLNTPTELESCYAVFISNQNRAIPLWMQKASKREDTLVIWDYHVVLLHVNPTMNMVYDLDTLLPLPVAFDEYVSKAIGDDSQMDPKFHRCFRVIPAKEFLSTFASDRSHMINDKGQWMAPPPAYPCLKTASSKNNIDDFISMDPSVGFGTVVDFQTFVARFSKQLDVRTNLDTG